MRPGAVFADLAAAVADGADCIDGVGQRCGDREHVFGAAASTTTMWRLVDERIDAAHLPGIRAARAHARATAWAAGAAPAPGEWLHIDIDATITIDHSDNKEQAAATWKKTFGHHSLLAFLDRPEIAGGEALAGLLRPGNAGSNTAADHVTVLEWALESLPAALPTRPRRSGRAAGSGALRFRRCHPRLRRRLPGGRGGVLLRLRRRRPGSRRGGNPQRGRQLVSGDRLRAAASATAPGSPKPPTLVDLSRWPAGTRLILRKERPHPGAQLRFTDSDGLRVTAFITDTPHRCRPRPARRTGTAAPPTRPGRGPHPRGQGHRPAQPALSPGRGERRLAGNHPGRNRSGGLDQTDRLHRPAAIWPAARSTPSATGSCTSPPASPAAPAKSGYASTPPGAGPPRSPKAGNDFGPPSPEQQTHPSNRPEDPTGPGKPAPERHRPTRHTHPAQSGPTAAQHALHPTRTGRAKNRG